LQNSFRIGELHRVEPSLNSVTGPAGTTRLEPKVMQVLVCLAAHAGEVVSKEQLLRAVWPDTFVGDDVLTRCVSELRRVFNDDVKEPRFIQTIPKGGYRLVAAVEIDAVRTASAALGTASPGVPALAVRRKSWQHVWSTRVGVTVVVVSVVVWFYPDRSRFAQLWRARSVPSDSPVKIVPFTRLPGEERQPAFSPDGSRIAFSWNGGTGRNVDVYVKLLAAPTILRLTDHPGRDFAPVWSPDGQYVAFVTDSLREKSVQVVSALGGASRKIAEGHWENAGWTHLDWSPDGRFLAIVDKTAFAQPYAIHLIAYETLERRQLTHPSPQYNDYRVAFSPDGTMLAFVRRTRSSFAVSDLYVVPVSGGTPRRLTFDNTRITDLAWTADGRAILFASARAGEQTVWKVAVKGGTPERLGIADGAVEIALRGGRLAYSRVSIDASVWKLIADSTAEKLSFDEMFPSTAFDAGAQFSPDGSKIVFMSARSGSAEIWLSDAGGGNLVQLSSFGGHAGTPRWPPDSRQIAFDARPEGHSDIYIVPFAGGSPRRLTTDPADDVVPSWSRDGRWLYFASNRSGEWQVWKMPSTGGPARQVTSGGGFAAFESPDGRKVYYSQFDSPGLWELQGAGGPEIRILDVPRAGYWGYWAPVRHGIYFVQAHGESQEALAFFDFARRQTRVIAELRGHAVMFEPGLAVSADEQSFLYVQMDRVEADISIVDGVR
jgi:Tol biopolymer transport system component/DNA-binding winged helix-turn-helix (wHTH) protein